jgi:hypothetical protein
MQVYSPEAGGVGMAQTCRDPLIAQDVYACCLDLVFSTNTQPVDALLTRHRPSRLPSLPDPTTPTSL